MRRNPDFRRLFGATLVSLLGSWFSVVAVSGLVYDLTGRAGAPALVFAATVLPIFLLAPVAGVVADVVDRRRLMVGADLARVVPAVGLVGAAVLGDARLAFACVIVMSALTAFSEPVAAAVLPNLVEDEDLSLAQAALGSAWGTMLFVGAAIGGLFTALVGREASFLVNGLSFAISAVLLLRIRRPFRSGPRPARASIVGHLGEVVRFVRPRKLTKALMVTKTGVGLGNGIVGLLPTFALVRYGAGDAGIGLLFAARGLGALIGPYVARTLARGDGRRQVALCGLSIVSYALAYSLLPITGSLAAAAACVALAHAGGGAQWVLSTHGLQVTTPDAIRGRLMSLDFGLATLAIGVSSLAASAAANAFGLERASLGLVAVALVYGLVWLGWTRDLWGAAHDPLQPVTVPREVPR